MASTEVKSKPAVPLFSAATTAPVVAALLPSTVESKAESKPDSKVGVKVVDKDAKSQSTVRATVEEKKNETILKLSQRPCIADVPAEWFNNNPHYYRVIHPRLLEENARYFYSVPCKRRCQQCYHYFPHPPIAYPLGRRDGRYIADHITPYCTGDCVFTEMKKVLGHQFNDEVELFTDMMRDVYGCTGPFYRVDNRIFSDNLGDVVYEEWLKDRTLGSDHTIVGYPFVDTPTVLQRKFKDIVAVPKTKKKTTTLQVTSQIKNLVASARADGEDLSGLSWTGETKDSIEQLTAKSERTPMVVTDDSAKLTPTRIHLPTSTPTPIPTPLPTTTPTVAPATTISVKTEPKPSTTTTPSKPPVTKPLGQTNFADTVPMLVKK